MVWHRWWQRWQPKQEIRCLHGVSAPVSETDLSLRCYVKLSGNRYLNVKLKTPHDRPIKKSLARKFQVITGHGKANRESWQVKRRNEVQLTGAWNEKHHITVHRNQTLNFPHFKQNIFLTHHNEYQMEPPVRLMFWIMGLTFSLKKKKTNNHTHKNKYTTSPKIKHYENRQNKTCRCKESWNPGATDGCERTYLICKYKKSQSPSQKRLLFVVHKCGVVVFFCFVCF